MTQYVTKAEILQRDDPRVTIDDFEANRKASYEREEAALTAAQNAVKKVWEGVDSEAAMLALNSAKVGHEAKRTDTKTIYTLKSLPASDINNWTLTAVYEVLPPTVDSITGLSDVLNDKLNIDGIAEDSHKLAGKTLSTIEAERNNAITVAINNLINGAPAAYDTLLEIANYIAQDQTGVEAMTTAINQRVNIDSIVDDLETAVNDRPLSANQGVEIKNMISNVNFQLSEIYSVKQDKIMPFSGWDGGDTPERRYITISDYEEGGSGSLKSLAKIVTAIINDLKVAGIFTD